MRIHLLGGPGSRKEGLTTPIDGVEVRDLSPGNLFIINPLSQEAFLARVIEPEEGKVSIRPRGDEPIDAVVGTLLEDTKELLSMSTNREINVDSVRWGSLVVGGELVIRNEADNLGAISATGQLIEFVQLFS